MDLSSMLNDEQASPQPMSTSPQPAGETPTPSLVRVPPLAVSPDAGEPITPGVQDGFYPTQAAAAPASVAKPSQAMTTSPAVARRDAGEGVVRKVGRPPKVKDDAAVRKEKEAEDLGVAFSGRTVYRWSLVEKPPGSLLQTSDLQQDKTAMCRMKPDLEGLYTLKLVVKGHGTSYSSKTRIFVERQYRDGRVVMKKSVVPDGEPRPLRNAIVVSRHLPGDERPAAPRIPA